MNSGRHWFLLTTMLLSATLLGSCGEGDPEPIGDPCDRRQTSEDCVLSHFQTAWRQREISEYAKLLATDFRFYPDAATRQELGVEFWDRATDSMHVACLFEDPSVTSIVIQLTWPQDSATSAGFADPRHTWTKLFLTDVFLDVDIMPPGGELTTYRVDDQTQRFFFRKGRTYPPSGPGDTLTYIVEWRDEGAVSRKPLSVDTPTTWSGIKARSDCSTSVTVNRLSHQPQ